MYGSVSLGQILVVAAVAAVFFGYKKLPDVSKTLGKSIRNFRRSLNEPDEIDITPKRDAGEQEKEKKQP